MSRWESWAVCYDSLSKSWTNNLGNYSALYWARFLSTMTNKSHGWFLLVMKTKVYIPLAKFLQSNVTDVPGNIMGCSRHYDRAWIGSLHSRKKSTMFIVSSMFIV